MRGTAVFVSLFFLRVVLFLLLLILVLLLLLKVGAERKANWLRCNTLAKGFSQAVPGPELDLPTFTTRH